MSKSLKEVLRYLWIMAGLFIVANGIVFLVQAQLGVAPWDVFHLGIAYQTGLSLGRVMQGVGFLLVLISWLFHVKPSFVTFINMFFLGFFVDLIMSVNYIPAPQLFWQKVAWYLIGIAVFGLGVAVYISPNRGAGPRDSVMLVLTRASKWRVGTIRTLMEVTAATVGYFLGGPLGLGTLLFALLVGFFMELGFACINVMKRSRLFQQFWYSGGETTGVGRG